MYEEKRLQGAETLHPLEFTFVHLAHCFRPRLAGVGIGVLTGAFLTLRGVSLPRATAFDDCGPGLAIASLLHSSCSHHRIQ